MRQNGNLDKLAKSSADACDNQFQEIYESALASAIELYASERPRLQIGLAARRDDALAAIIGFGGALIHGFAALMTSESVIFRLAGDPTVNPHDWLGELNNQVVGRFKNNLARRGINTRMGSPIRLSADMLEIGANGTKPIVWRIVWSSGYMNGLLVVESADELSLEPVEPTEVAKEGSVNLF